MVLLTSERLKYTNRKFAAKTRDIMKRLEQCTSLLAVWNQPADFLFFYFSEQGEFYARF